MEKSVAIFATINFLIIGLSHIIQHKGWQEFFHVLHASGRAGAFANGFLTLLPGSIIVAFHNVWSGCADGAYVDWLGISRQVTGDFFVSRLGCPFNGSRARCSCHEVQSCRDCSPCPGRDMWGMCCGRHVSHLVNAAQEFNLWCSIPRYGAVRK